MSDDGLLAEQRAYYEARAPEYDEWWQRRGRYDQGREPAEEWDREVAQVAAALETVDATGDVLELAGGTGWSGGRVSLIDNRHEAPDAYVMRRDSDLELRRVHDGTEFQVVEVFYEPGARPAGT